MAVAATRLSLALVGRNGADAVAVVVAAVLQLPLDRTLTVLVPEGVGHRFAGPQRRSVGQQPPPRFSGQA